MQNSSDPETMARTASASIQLFEVNGIEQADAVRAVPPASQAWYRGPEWPVTPYRIGDAK